MCGITSDSLQSSYLPAKLPQSSGVAFESKAASSKNLRHQRMLIQSSESKGPVGRSLQIVLCRSPPITRCTILTGSLFSLCLVFL